jgi:serine/threonine-protein kinase
VTSRKPDDQRVIFASTRAGNPNLYWQRADGSGAIERLTTGGLAQFPTSVSPDGKHVMFFELATGSNISIVSFQEPRQTEVLMQTPATETNAEISPDGRFVAYQSTESGAPDVYVRPFPKLDGGRWQISPQGGSRPVWARSGRELFYLDGKGLLTAVSVQLAGPTFAAGPAS